MPSVSPNKTAKSLSTKIALAISGVFLFFLLLEAGLRLGGFLILSLQEYRNLQTIKQKGAYRIMCIGECGVTGQYPSFLEEALNGRDIGINFSVNNNVGKSGMATPLIVASLASRLDQYRPDMVIAMLGINDWGPYTTYETPSVSKFTLLLRSLRVYKLAGSLWLKILAQRNSGSSVDSLKKAIEFDPQNNAAYAELGALYFKKGMLSEAQDLFEKAIDFNPRNYAAYAWLGWFYQSAGKFSQVEDLYKKVIELDPQNYAPYAWLGWFYQSEGKFSQAEVMHKKAIELNPQDDDGYVGLGLLYGYEGKFSQAEDLFKKAIELRPGTYPPYIWLGWIYQSEGKFSQAEDMLKKAVELKPRGHVACGALTLLYEAMGKPEPAKAYAEKTQRLRLEKYYITTVTYYRKLKEILDQRGIRLVCVQYPLRNVEPLKQIFEDDQKEAVFVDNKKIFRDAVGKDGYLPYFIDMFGGDFGNCTAEGNRLLAGNIAETILKEVFKK